MTELVLGVDHFCEHSEYSTEPFGPWSETYSFNVGSTASISKPGMYPSMYPNATYTDGELQIGETIYVIIANWSGGDSFGYANRKYWDAVIVNRSEDLANTNLAALTDGTGLIELQRDNGETIKYCPDWTGYFESLDTLAVFRIRIVG